MATKPIERQDDAGELQAAEMVEEVGDFNRRWRARFDPAAWRLLEDAAGSLE